MGKPIELTFLSDVSDFLKGTKNVEVSVEDLADALNAVTKDAPELERKLSKAMRDAEKDVESLERAIRDLPKATDKAADQGRRDFDRLGDSAREAGQEVGDEFKQNLGESLASGNLEDLFSDTLGGLLSSLKGPIGAAAGVGAGLALAVWQTFRQESEKQKELLNQVLDITDEVTGELDKLGLMRLAIEQLGGDDYGQGLKDAAKYSREIGISAEDLFAVISGDLNPASEKTLGYLQDEAKYYDDLVQKRKLTTDEKERREAVREVLATTQLTVDAVKEGKKAQDTWNEATGTTRDETENMAKAADAAAAKLDSQAAAAKRVQDSVTVSLQKLREINSIPDKTIRVNIDTRIQGSAPAAAYIGKYVV